MTRIPVALLMLLPAVGCFETPSAIVAFAEAHGSGDLRSASAASIQLWAHNHQPLAQEIDRMCRAQQPGDATWGNTTEGRLCLAVRRQAFFNKGAHVPDTRTYDPVTGVH